MPALASGGGEAHKRVVARTVLTLVLALATLFGPAMPWYARLVAGPATHVCHCDAHHDDCACPICFPDREDLKKNELAVRGPCGEKDVVYGAASVPAVLPPAVAVLHASPVTLVLPQAISVVPSHGPSPPEPPPPRA